MSAQQSTTAVSVDHSLESSALFRGNASARDQEFIWQMNAPYLLTGAVLLAVALLTRWQAMGRQRAARRA